MTQRKIRINGYYGCRTETPFEFVPKGIFLKLLLHKENGFIIEHDIIADDNKIKQYIHYNKKSSGCGSFTGMCELI